MTCYRSGGCGPYENHSCYECPASKPEYLNRKTDESSKTVMSNLICNRSEDLEALVPYINKPVYVRGFCWNKRFDGWTVIYENYCESSIFNTEHLVFDYRGHTYPVFGFLPSKSTLPYNSKHNNAFYEEDPND